MLTASSVVTIKIPAPLLDHGRALFIGALEAGGAQVATRRNSCHRDGGFRQLHAASI